MTDKKEALDNWLNGTILKSVDKKWTLGRYKFHYEQRLKSNIMGRFGGGWNWKLGFQASKSSVIFSFLVASLHITKCPACYVCNKWAHQSVYKKIEQEWHNFHKDCWEEFEANTSALS